MVTLVTYILSKVGWEDLAQKFRTDKSFEGRRLGITSIGINGASYRNSIVLKFNRKGIYLRPILFFRLFHPPVLIPWEEIKQVRDKRILIINLKELVIGDPFIAMITMKASTFDKIRRPDRW